MSWCLEREPTLPVLCICRGMQMLAIVSGATMIQDLRTYYNDKGLLSIEGTPLKVIAVTPTAGIDIVEAIERTDKPFFIGLQYHPEVAVTKHADGADDASRFMSYDDALRYFRALTK